MTGGIPAKCPKCGRKKPWKEEVNVFKSGIPMGIFGRIRIGSTGILAGPIRKALGHNKVAYRCHHCGFRNEYHTED